MTAIAHTVNELKIMIDILIDLGHGDGVITIDDSRDGIESHTSASVSIKKTGSTQDPQIVLLVK
jgi:hypothetical protein